MPMHPKPVNPLRLEILFKVLGLFPLIPFPPSTFDYMMRRPKRTSWRTSKNVAFIWNAKLSYRTLPTLLSLRSFGLRVGNLFLRDP